MIASWIGVDLDGTLAKYDGWHGPGHIGDPIPAMVDRVKQWLEEGKRVKIFTARIFSDGTAQRDQEAMTAMLAIRKWCADVFGRALPVTCVKDFGMVALYDDRCVQVELNTGRLIGE